MTYQEIVKKTCAIMSEEKQWLLGAIGLCGEAGEVAECIKKPLFHGHQFDKEKLLKELGDVRWYLELLCISLGVSIEQVEKANIEKLSKRYPNGFTIEDSIARKDT